jgi:UDP-glucuronate decarboxylase
LTSINLISAEEVKSIASRIDFEKFANKRVVITGASGLVGGYLTYALIKCTYFLGSHAPEVLAVSRNGNFPNLHDLKDDPRLKFLSLDLEKEEIKFDYEILVHAASTASPTKKISRESIFNVNCHTLRLLHKNPGLVKKILFVSAGEVYGADAPRQMKESYRGNIDTQSYRANYPEAKLAGEKLTSTLNEIGIQGRVARLFHSFGPGLRNNDGRSFADFLSAASVGNLPVLRSSGSQIRSFLYLEDTIVGLLSVLNSEISAPVNVGSENELSILQFASKISSIAGLGGEVLFQTNLSDTVYSPNNVIVPSNELLRSIGWNQCVDVESGIERTLHWLRNLSLPAR